LRFSSVPRARFEHRLDALARGDRSIEPRTLARRHRFKDVAEDLLALRVIAQSQYSAHLVHGDAFLFRNRSGAPYSSDTLGDNFRDVRHMVFGPEETRTLADFRRSGAQEAFAGDAQPADVSHAMGDAIATANTLFATYNPVNMASVREVHGGPD
jgi:hypothetical protein